MSYYASLKNNKQFSSLSSKGKKSFLLQKEIFKKTFKKPIKSKNRFISFSQIRKAFGLKGKLVVSPIKELQEEFYWFLVNHYENEIMNSFVEFCLDFDTKCFGLDNSEVKKVALQLYKQIKEEVVLKGFDLIEYNKQGIIKNINTFKYIYGRRNGLIMQQNKNEELVFLFLSGKIKNVLAHNNLIEEHREIIDFESKCKLLVYLNYHFNFENDNYVTKSFSNNVTKITNSESVLEILDKSGKNKEKVQDFTKESAIQYLLQNHF